MNELQCRTPQTPWKVYPLLVIYIVDLLFTKSIVFKGLNSFSLINTRSENIVHPQLPWKDICQHSRVLQLASNISQPIQDMHMFETELSFSLPVERWLPIQYTVANNSDVAQSATVAVCL